jgi:hypothetical protein
VLFWMPFAITADDGDPASLPGFTTRAEVSRELARASHRIVLGMPPGAFSSSHIRYHAQRRGDPRHARGDGRRGRRALEPVIDGPSHRCWARPAQREHEGRPGTVSRRGRARGSTTEPQVELEYDHAS